MIITLHWTALWIASYRLWWRYFSPFLKVPNHDSYPAEKAWLLQEGRSWSYVVTLFPLHLPSMFKSLPLICERDGHACPSGVTRANTYWEKRLRKGDEEVAVSLLYDNTRGTRPGLSGDMEKSRIPRRWLCRLVSQAIEPGASWSFPYA